VIFVYYINDGVPVM